ncbi:putative elongation factor EF-G [Cardiosporidium cionae]|uniref:Elongation factor G, mitochondrial n=1 Tax=Cardiosporidium cionae TaxID=476202 RepID=A0ABQ7JGE0_9APIC|nr:putative elongation factor EF-G [Cardiosporidium cionae]|eukprot:KAF8823009.1 putative elongation factor EF-G [Cardiosporidium cionae]
MSFVLSNSLTRGLYHAASRKNLYVKESLLPKSILRAFFPSTTLRGSFGKVWGTNAFHSSVVTTGGCATRRRNIGISAHIDSGKTTLTERILFYAGRIKHIHEVRGSDGVGAKMDSMELEREKGLLENQKGVVFKYPMSIAVLDCITIQSAATHCLWNLGNSQYAVNIIDTPGHVDFTIEVERALRVLDGAVLVCCGVAAVQSQTLTVDRQMKRYNVPRIIFLNKLDRDGADPNRALKIIRSKLAIPTIPIGLSTKHRGVVEVIPRKAYIFHGQYGEAMQCENIPEDMNELVETVRRELLETLAETDDIFAEKFIEGEEYCTEECIHAAIRRCTISRKLSPLLMGSAKSNKGIQLLLNAVCRYLPAPDEVQNFALNLDDNERETALQNDPKKPLVGLVFKIQELPIGQLAYIRIYQGYLKKGDTIMNMSTGKKTSTKRVLKLHADEVKECDYAEAGDIVAISGLDCFSGTTFTDGTINYTLYSMFVPEPVVSWSIKPKSNLEATKFSKALNRFQREDPTFRIHTDAESKEVVMSGMGELQLNIYVERMRREYGLNIEVGEPKVNFRETVTATTEFEYLHKKQSGGAGQYGKIIGRFEPISEDLSALHFDVMFENKLLGNQISPSHISSIEKGFRDCSLKGLLTGSPVINIRYVLVDGASHVVDSSDFAFRSAAQGAFRSYYERASPIVLEPIMQVELVVPTEFQSAALASLIKRKANISSTANQEDTVVIQATVGLKEMFGYISDLRACTQGQGAYSMEFYRYEAMNSQDQEVVTAKYAKSLVTKNK